MSLSLPQDDLVRYFEHLLDTSFPDAKAQHIAQVVDRALERLEHCFAHVALPGYRDEGGACFDHLHGDQAAAFTYLLANTAWRDFENTALAKKLTLLNRMRHAILIMYDTQLPDIFLIPHTVGTVIGKAEYADYLVVCQNVTIANDLSTRLSIAAGVIFFPGSFVVGTGTIGEGSVITANATVQYQDILPNTVVSGRSPNIEMRQRSRDFLARFFLPPYPGHEG